MRTQYPQNLTKTYEIYGCVFEIKSKCTSMSVAQSMYAVTLVVVNREQFSEVGRTNIEKDKERDTRTKKKESKIGRHR